MVAHVYTLSTRKVEEGKLWQVQGQPDLYSEFKDSLSYNTYSDPVSKKIFFLNTSEINFV